MPSFAVILPAAGKSSRFGDPLEKKPFASLEGRPVWVCAAEQFTGRSDVQQTLLVVAPDDREHFQEKFGANAAMLGVQVVEGGRERYDSVVAALALVRPEIEYVAVHDAARPCVPDELVEAVFAAAVKVGAAIPATPIQGTIKRAGADQTIRETVPREGLWEAQTPQVFARQLLIDAYARRGQQAATDDAQLVERLGQAIAIVPGSPMNLKITTKEDLRLAAAILRSRRTEGRSQGRGQSPGFGRESGKSGLSLFSQQGT